MQSSTAAFTASLVMVAPVMASTLTDWFSIMRGISLSTTQLTIGGVSERLTSSTLMSMILLWLRMVVTVIGSHSAKPALWAVYVPGFMLTFSSTASTRPACVMASLAASRMALLETVAPVTASTSHVPASSMRAGSSSTAREPMPCVSLSPAAVTPLSAPPSTSTVTAISPPKPAAVPVKVSANAAAQSTVMSAARMMHTPFFIVFPPFLPGEKPFLPLLLAL